MKLPRWLLRVVVDVNAQEVNETLDRMAARVAEIRQLVAELAAERGEDQPGSGSPSAPALGYGQFMPPTFAAHGACRGCSCQGRGDKLCEHCADVYAWWTQHHLHGDWCELPARQ